MMKEGITMDLEVINNNSDIVDVRDYMDYSCYYILVR